jgi:tetratricopeptide (TPR) repeat protein
MKLFLGNYATCNQDLICLATILLAGLITLGGCAQEPPPLLTHSESQAIADEEWIKGADRPPTPRTLLALSRVYISQGREQEAQFILHNVTKKHPYYPEAYVELAEIHMRHRRVSTAIKTLSEGLVCLPKDHVITNNLGMCHLIRRNYRAAEGMFRTAAAIAPNNTRYRSNVALVLGLQGRYEEALALYKQVTNDIEAHFNLAVICDARNDRKRAAEERKKVKMYKARAVKAKVIPQGDKAAEK